MTVRVVLADDMEVVRMGVRTVLESEPDIEVVGEAGDGRRAYEVVRELRPHVVLMDVRMPHLDGLAVTRMLAEDPVTRSVKVLVFTTFDLDEYVYGALAAGASGFLLKDMPVEHLAGAIRVVHGGQALIAPSATRRLVETTIRREGRSRPPLDLEDLTAREHEVLLLLARGLSNAEIAAALVVGEATVKTHVGRVMTKLGLRDRVHAVVASYESGLVVPGGD